MKYKIALFIENTEIRKTLEIILEMQDYEIFHLQTIEEWGGSAADLIILQGQPSPAILSELRRMKEKDVLVLVITNSKETIIDQFLSNGADDYLIWPNSPKQILTRITNVLSLKLNYEVVKKAVDLKTQELMEVQSVMIESLASLAEYRDADTGGHIRRTQNYVKALAMELSKSPKYRDSLSEENIELIYLSVPLHDIGKVGERDEILLKPGKLSEEEFEVMKQHTIIGYDAIMSAERKLNNNAFLRYAAEAAYTNQEKWDGSGYPRGISGEEIPLIGRLMAVADVYDALVSKRVYKEAVDHETAKEIILEGSGSHFDPDIVEAFKTVEGTFRNIAAMYADVIDIKEKKKLCTSEEKDNKIKNILLVDDSKFMLAMFSNQLKNNGYHVFAFLEAKSAYDWFLSHDNIDLIITDLEMPEIDGYEFVKMIREGPHVNGKTIPIFALTASRYNLSMEEARERGFTDYMLKPLDLELLKCKLGELASEHTGGKSGNGWRDAE